uniref:SnoaL-like domain-containing protein n=1 Tax=Aegilops tauschii subsp. strangulata TaxID=200361 RepID=A0A453MMX9_AEGTS
MPSPLSACKHPNTMNSALTHISFQSPSFNLIQRPQSRHQQISIKWRKRQQCSAKPIRAIPGPNATGAYGGGNALPSSPLTDVIQEFYSSLNDKDITRLEKLISLDCVIEDTAYYKPLDVKNARTYFTRLIKVMGKNAKFAIDEVCQGVEPTVAVMWHLGKILLHHGIGIISVSQRQYWLLEDKDFFYLFFANIEGKDNTVVSSCCLLQSGAERSSHLPRAAVSSCVQ